MLDILQKDSESVGNFNFRYGQTKVTPKEYRKTKMSCNSGYTFFIISYVEVSKYNKHKPGKWKVKFFFVNANDVALVSLLLTLNIFHLASVSIVNFEHAIAGCEPYSKISLLLNSASISTLFQRCFSVDTASRRGAASINVETTLCILTLEFITSNNIESMLFISTLVWTTLNNTPSQP